MNKKLYTTCPFCWESLHKGLEMWKVSWWSHQMETFSAYLALCEGNSPVPVNSPHKGQWRGALMLSLICVWKNGWVNNREAGDLRRHRGHYDVNVMYLCRKGIMIVTVSMLQTPLLLSSPIDQLQDQLAMNIQIKMTHWRSITAIKKTLSHYSHT